MTRRIEAGTVAAAIGAAMVLVSLFLDWFKPGLSAWTTFEVLDLVLAAASAAILLSCLSRLSGAGAAGDGELHDRWLPLAAIAALVIVVATLINHPPAAIGLGVKLGIWIALGGAVLMTLGALADRAEVSLSFSARRPEPGRPVEPSASGPVPGSPRSGETATDRLAERETSAE